MGETSQKIAVVATLYGSLLQLSVNAKKRKRLSKKFNDSHFAINFLRNLKTFKMIMKNLSWHIRNLQ